ncbi:MAG: class B sortase [Faecousia sp.]
MKRLNKQRLLTMAAVFFAAVFVFSAVMLYREYADQKKSAEAFEDIAALIQTEPTEPEESNADEETGTTEETEPAGLSAYETYGAVYEQNHDFVGWIRIEGTNIDYPVMQTPDNPDFYLKHGFDKEYSAYGVPYMQENCVLGQSDNLVIYGHHMNNGSMFADLCKYTDKDFYAEHKTIRFDTLSEFGEYEIVAVFKTVAYSEDGFKYYHFVDGNEEEFDSYIAKCRELALYDTGVTAEYGDQLITLSTCEYSRTNGRMVVVAKKIASPIGEVNPDA